MTAEEKDETLGRLTLATDLGALASCDLVIEAVIEDIATKAAVFEELDDLLAPDAILATNTSALSVTEIADVTERPERVVGMHFFNPAPVLKLVEVVRTAHTPDDVFAAAFAFAEKLGKDADRLQRHAGLRRQPHPHPAPERLRPRDRRGPRLTRGRRPRDDLWRELADRACALIDLIGVDIHVHASEALEAALGEERMGPPPRLRKMLESGELGRKTKKGFFTYD